MKTLYFDCFAGASGNMILGALASMGIESEMLRRLKLLDIPDFEIEFKTVDKSGISATHAEVKVPHEHAHRHLHTIEKIINDSRLADSVKERAIKIFTRLAEAEAKIHGIDVQKVHFHEVGAMDAIVDVVGACIGFEILGVENFVCSKIHVGSGFAKMAHGKFPVPPPAVAELLRGKQIYSTEIEGELITPTGAAIIATVCEEFGQVPEMFVRKVAYGAGTREYKDFPNVLRLIYGDVEREPLSFYTPSKNNFLPPEMSAEDFVLGFKAAADLKEQELERRKKRKIDFLVLIETNIDDLSPQTLGFVMERAFETGALDCWFTPIQMKKNRPATMISVLCEPRKREVLTELLYRETSTLGVRVRDVERDCLPREIVKVETKFGEISVKTAKLNGKITNAKPEYDQLKSIAERENLPLREVEAEVLRNLKNE